MASKPTKVMSLKLLIDSKGHKVLFAEANKDFIDFLFTIFSLPVGTVVRILTKEKMVGCLGKLFESIENLSETYMQPNVNKDSVLIPKAPNCSSSLAFPLLLPNNNVSSTNTKVAFSCINHCCSYVTDDSTAICPTCRNRMSRQMTYVAPPVGGGQASLGGGEVEGGYVKGVVTYMVMDDLVVQPMSTISSITLFNKFNIKEVGALEEKVVRFTVDEVEKFLKASLQSNTVLTDVFLRKREPRIVIAC